MAGLALGDLLLLGQLTKDGDRLKTSGIHAFILEWNASLALLRVGNMNSGPM